MNEELLLNSLKEYYSNNNKSKILISVINNNLSISLRSIDWFITNYSKKHNIYYNIYMDKNNKLTFDEKNNKFIDNISPLTNVCLAHHLTITRVDMLNMIHINSVHNIDTPR